MASAAPPGEPGGPGNGGHRPWAGDRRDQQGTAEGWSAEGGARVQASDHGDVVALDHDAIVARWLAVDGPADQVVDPFPVDVARIVVAAVLADAVTRDPMAAQAMAELSSGGLVVRRAGQRWAAVHRSVTEMVDRLGRLRTILDDATAPTWPGRGLPVARAVDVVMAEAASAMVAQVEALARTDALTGVGNRRAFDEAVTATLATAARLGIEVTMAVVDLDGLKRINDTRGHGAGDAALTQLVRALGTALRSTDSVYRIGGDEFVVLMPGAPPGEVDALMARVVAAGAPAFTWGASSLPVGSADAATLFDRADHALYARRADHRAVARGAPARRVSAVLGAGRWERRHLVPEGATGGSADPRTTGVVDVATGEAAVGVAATGSVVDGPAGRPAWVRVGWVPAAAAAVAVVVALLLTGGTRSPAPRALSRGRSPAARVGTAPSPALAPASPRRPQGSTPSAVGTSPGRLGPVAGPPTSPAATGPSTAGAFGGTAAATGSPSVRGSTAPHEVGVVQHTTTPGSGETPSGAAPAPSGQPPAGTSRPSPSGQPPSGTSPTPNGGTGSGPVGQLVADVGHLVAGVPVLDDLIGTTPGGGTSLLGVVQLTGGALAPSRGVATAAGFEPTLAASGGG